jgi:hypothetical protein
MTVIITVIMLNLMSFGQLTNNSFENRNIQDHLEEHSVNSTFMSDTKKLIEAIKSKEIETLRTNYETVAKILGLEADEFGMTGDVEYDNDMILNIYCTVRRKYKYVKIISYDFSPVFDTENIEYGHISSYLKKEFGKPKETLKDAIFWEFNEQKISLTKNTGSLNFNIKIESMVNED